MGGKQTKNQQTAAKRQTTRTSQPDLVYVQNTDLAVPEAMARQRMDALAEAHGFDYVLLPKELKVVGVVPGYQRPQAKDA
jgi:hypothetical protein